MVSILIAVSGEGSGVPSSIPILIPNLPTSEALLPYLRQIDRRRIYTNYGPLSEELCARLGSFFGRHDNASCGVTLTTNGTTALELALRARTHRGGLCFMPAYTFVATAHAVYNAGLEPYLTDVDEHSLAITPEIARRAISDSRAKPVAVVVVSPFGAPINVAEWEEFERELNLPVIFDAAAAATAIRYVGQQPICISLHATKVLGIGEGGAILSRDFGLIDRTIAMTGFGFARDARVSSVIGGNYRLSEYSAAMGLASLDSLASKVNHLREIAECYARLLPKHARLQDGCGSSWVSMTHNIILCREAVPELLSTFERCGIQWRRWWGLGCHQHPAFVNLRRSDLKTTDDVAPRVIGIPFHGFLTRDQIAHVCRCVEEATI
jgi:dTDP-4-amino-4,6-dideoxygalactose transaminase